MNSTTTINTEAVNFVSAMSCKPLLAGMFRLRLKEMLDKNQDESALGCSDQLAARRPQVVICTARSAICSKRPDAVFIEGVFRPVFHVKRATRPYPSVVFEPSTGSTGRTMWSTEPCFSSAHESALSRTQIGI